MQSLGRIWHLLPDFYDAGASRSCTPTENRKSEHRKEIISERALKQATRIERDVTIRIRKTTDKYGHGMPCPYRQRTTNHGPLHAVMA